MNSFNRAELKEKAKGRIKGIIFNLLVANLIVMAILGPINGVPGFGQLILLAASVIQFGLAFLYLNFVDNNKIDYADLFYSFKVKDINTYLIHLGTLIVKYLLICLYTLLLIVPGIIKAMAYSQVNYIRAENKEQDIMACLKESEELMDGHKMEYFIMQLSFIGWWIVSGLTFGIALIYVLPYYSTTMTMYYRSLRPVVIEAGEARMDKEPEIS